MRIRHVVLGSALVAVTFLPAPSFGVSKEIIQLQTQVQQLQDQMTAMSTTFNERMGVIRNLIEQSTDNMNKMTQQMDTLTRTLQQQQQDGGNKADQLSGQIQSLHDSVDELKARVAALSKKLDDMSQQSQNLNANAGNMPNNGGGNGGGGGGAPVANQAPPADVLYNNALRDYNAGKYDLASGEFGDFMKFYADNDLAGNAQFYIADIEYRQGNFDNAVKDYDKVLEQYPSGNKAPAAQLKKGFALLELGQKDAGVRELRSLINRYPRSIEAQQARDRLARLSGGAAPATKRKPS
ncbi:Tetratricopeptide repeat protein [Candidatus Koribacter versatilis Ellin345]|uniref:Tetratricopeptide repeat protein n=1 Tax=Koribacter versatilis (strain Ellin345) TaxID=204669 RepID=Q1IU55_KORVE|nr:tetratricopeptide repeat protein [Candidatus Koribacter versatilis]ABF39595.1 Tetratricopeptide repeat protein [Candidatus Koribacter versatilis Ellin345]